MGLGTSDARLVLTGSPYGWLFGDFFATFGQATLDNGEGTKEQMIVRSPSTFVFWDLVQMGECVRWGWIEGLLRVEEEVRLSFRLYHDMELQYLFVFWIF